MSEGQMMLLMMGSICLTAVLLVFTAASTPVAIAPMVAGVGLTFFVA